VKVRHDGGLEGGYGLRCRQSVARDLHGVSPFSSDYGGTAARYIV
jgi:hypothetical protein